MPADVNHTTTLGQLQDVLGELRKADNGIVLEVEFQPVGRYPNEDATWVAEITGYWHVTCYRANLWDAIDDAITLYRRRLVQHAPNVYEESNTTKETKR